jgi:hypothetical protein
MDFQQLKGLAQALHNCPAVINGGRRWGFHDEVCSAGLAPSPAA